MNLTAQVQYGYNNSYDKLIKTIVLPDVKFSIGPVPFLIHSTIPVHVGFSTSLFADTGKIQATARMDADVRYGVQYTPYAGFQYIHEHHHSYDGGI